MNIRFLAYMKVGKGQIWGGPIVSTHICILHNLYDILFAYLYKACSKRTVDIVQWTAEFIYITKQYYMLSTSQYIISLRPISKGWAVYHHHTRYTRLLYNI